MLKYDHLLNIPFSYKTQNCYHTVQGFYAANFGIELPDYACPKDFWDHGLDLYMTRYRKCGFYPLECHPSEYQPGDIILCAIDSSVANHIGVFVENGQVLHHLLGRLSTVESYRALLRNTTVAIMRHKDVQLDKTETTANLLDLVSPRIKRKLNEHLASSGTV
ncbi:C40 family peptidase [Ensifer sp. ENS04]|uniref:NlpC/P60 family protein n=1 Tax=Ensifer sp. ENS04 TaxID=2769281 RepID=UPI00177E3DF8|nr:NlpC/P60 family protein [Ensifer sp. ENS04]MBD9544248.1 C40 family peptidase [Ensifer sp. ENS04]